MSQDTYSYPDGTPFKATSPEEVRRKMQHWMEVDREKRIATGQTKRNALTEERLRALRRPQ